VDLLAPYRAELSAAFDGPVASAMGIFERGNNVERLREVAIGNLLADAIRLRYGTQLGFVNGGGIRAPLPSSYAPADRGLRRPAEGYAAGPPFDLVVGDVYTVLPFGNSVATRTVSGAQLWQMLEHSVEALPAPAGWFGQISGFRFTFDSSRPARSRVVSVALEDGTPVLADETRYTLATSDFIDAGGDGYTMLAGGDGIPQDLMADVVVEHVKGLASLAPEIQSRITDQAPPPR
jgi:5'-nucleotidase